MSERMKARVKQRLTSAVVAAWLVALVQVTAAAESLKVAGLPVT